MCIYIYIYIYINQQLAVLANQVLATGQSSMSFCSGALWNLAGAGTKGKTQESCGNDTPCKRRKTEDDLAMDKACAEAIVRYNRNVLTTLQLQELKDRKQERRLSCDVFLSEPLLWELCSCRTCCKCEYELLSMAQYEFCQLMLQL